MSSSPSDGDQPRATALTRQSTMNVSSKLVETSKRILDADVPNGMWTATARTAQAPTLIDIREARYTTDRIEQNGKTNEDGSDTRQQSSDADNTVPRSKVPTALRRDLKRTATENETDEALELENKVRARANSRPLPDNGSTTSLHITATGHYPNGYKFPPKHTWKQSTRIGFLAFVDFLRTPFGIALAIYGLNVVAWGAMIFFLLIGAASNTMCNVQRPYDSGHWVHDCNDLYSPRRIWIEVDSQVLTVLFCITAFGLVPWRFRDLFYLLKWRLTGHKTCLRRLAAWHRSWFRLPGSDQLDPNMKAGFHDVTYNLSSLPEPLEKAPDPPLTGYRAPPTAGWKMDFVVWSAAFNTFFQIVLCYYMWHENRFVRPSWATGCFVALGCISAGLGGVMQFFEGKRIKMIEGIPFEVGQSVEQVVERGAISQV